MATRAVQPPLEFIPPAFNPLVCRTAQWLTPAWLRWRVQIDEFDYENLAGLVDLIHQFDQGKTRLLLAFRHPSPDDPFCLMQLFAQALPQAARHQGKTIPSPSHFHFLYDRGIPLWAGDFAGWLYAKLGGIPIHRGKLDMQGLRTARELLVKGRFPLAAAPEGATNGHSEIVSPIEPGLAQLGVWAVQDLLKLGRDESVQILPIGIRYNYPNEPWEQIDRLLTQLEQDCGLTALSQADDSAQAGQHMRYTRLYHLAQHVLYSMEDYYKRFYQQPLPGYPLGADAVEALAAEEFRSRLQSLLNAALGVAEDFFNLTPQGSIIDRCRRLEQAGWDRIYREDLGQLHRLSALDVGLADRVAAEAQMRLWHMRIVESFVAVTGSYVREKPTPERFAESTLLLWKLLSQLKGEARPGRPQLGRRRVQITIGEPLSATAAYAQALAKGEKPRRAGRVAVNQLNEQLQRALEAMTHP